MATQTVTLLTDWGNTDHYAAVVRARLFAKIPDVRVVDISHSVPRGDVWAAAYMAIDTYPYFPENTIHIVGVEDISTTENVHMVVRFGHQYIIGTDNGFFTILQILSGRKMDPVYQIDISPESKVHTFPSRDLFSKVASMLSAGMSLDQIGKPAGFHSRIIEGPGIEVQRTFDKDSNDNIIEMQLSGRVLFVDSFGNVVTNITRKQCEACLTEYDFSELYAASRKIPGRFKQKYTEVAVAAPVFIFLENGFLEIAVNRGSIYKMFGITPGSKVIMRFKPKTKQ